MIDNSLIDSLAFLDGIDKLVEDKAQEYLNPSKILSILEVNYQDVSNLTLQLSKYASQTLFYSALAARLNSSLYQYEENVFNKYMAHCRLYGSLYCDSIGKKDTKDAIQDMIILLYTRDNNAEDKFNFAIACFDEKYKEQIKKTELVVGSEAYNLKAREFYKEMYKFDLQGKFYETFIEQKAKLEYRKDLAESLSESLNQLGICASQICKLKLSGSSEVPTISLATVQKLRKLQGCFAANMSDEVCLQHVNS
jgi:hypothetical protein